MSKKEPVDKNGGNKITNYFSIKNITNTNKNNPKPQTNRDNGKTKSKFGNDYHESSREEERQSEGT